MIRSVIICSMVALGCILPVHALFAQNAGNPSATVHGVLYRCLQPSGSVEFTNVPKAGCVVVATYTAKQQDEQNNEPAKLIERGSYVNRDGVVVHSPAHTVSDVAPAGASAQCQDGSYSFSQHHRGTCSHHGGVAKWL
jgi:hypothetical protein